MSPRYFFRRTSKRDRAGRFEHVDVPSPSACSPPGCGIPSEGRYGGICRHVAAAASACAATERGRANTSTGAPASTGFLRGTYARARSARELPGAAGVLRACASAGGLRSMKACTVAKAACGGRATSGTRYARTAWGRPAVRAFDRGGDASRSRPRRFLGMWKTNTPRAPAPVLTQLDGRGFGGAVSSAATGSSAGSWSRAFVLGCISVLSIHVHVRCHEWYYELNVPATKPSSIHLDYSHGMFNICPRARSTRRGSSQALLEPALVSHNIRPRTRASLYT
jgi:hypothetical protein